jgi:hypothetical protein
MSFIPGGRVAPKEICMAGVQAEHTAGSGLTTTKAPFIEEAQQEGRLYIHQPCELSHRVSRR